MRVSVLLSKALVVFLAVIFLSSCGSPPTIRESIRIDKSNIKIEQIVFVYRKSVLKTASSRGMGTSSANETGYENFGKILIEEAPDIFPAYGVKLIDSKMIEGKLPIKTLMNQLFSNGKASRHTLWLYASSGRATANRHSIRINYVFDTFIVDRISKKIIWKAKIDTSTWSGRDFVQKNFTKTLYDKEYAKQLLTLIADKLKEDNLL